jgi:glucose dehydrogenase
VAAPVAIAGSGIVGAALAHALTAKGIPVEVFEKGKPFPYPPTRAFEEQVLYRHRPGGPELPDDLKNLTQKGSYRQPLNSERIMVVGGSATQWGAMCDRMHPHDFETRTRYGYGADWPISYADLEPYYGRAEELLGVSGSDAGDPFAPQRSSPYPMGAFELGHDTRLLTERLRGQGLFFRTSPQARTRAVHDGRMACANFGTCWVCPLGARYFPNHHLARAVATGLCRVHSEHSVRRILVDGAGRARGLLVRRNDGGADEEIPAAVVVVAAGALESARLLLLSEAPGFPGGLRNTGGHIGRHLLLHHIWAAHLDFAEDLFPARTGPEMAQSRQFLDPPTRGRHGGVLLQLPSDWDHQRHRLDLRNAQDGRAVLEAMRARTRCELVWLHAESAEHQDKFVALGDRKDRFGDPFLDVTYVSSDFDRRTYDFALGLLDRVRVATRARAAGVRDRDEFSSGFHHMGTCRMGTSVENSVVDSECRVHGTQNLFVVGGSVFASAGAVHPTLTMVALALRTADRIIERRT